MRKLKNWTVIIKSIQSKKDNLRGLFNLYDYIYDLKNHHPNHSTKDFHQVVGFEKNHHLIVKNFATLQQKMDLQHSLKKGRKASGRKASYGSSLMLSLPADIKLTETDFKKIRDLMLIKLVDFISSEYNLNYTKEQRDKYINSFILSTAHIQNSNNHINILVPNVFIDYNNSNNLIRVNLGKRKVSYFIKNSLNSIMLDYFNTNCLDYKIKAHKQTKKPNTLYAHKLKEVEEKKEDLKSQFEKLTSLYDSTNDTISKIQKRVSIYIARMDTSIFEKDKDKFEKNKELVISNIEKLKKDFTPQKDTDIFEKIKATLYNKSYNNHTINMDLGR